MSYKIPPDDVVARALDDCLVKSPRMRSQRELCDAVRAELAYIDPDYRIGGERIRRIGIERGIIGLDISYAANDRAVGDDCPVCGNRLVSVRNRTLDGDTVELSRSCRLCGYIAKGTETRPARYGVYRKERVDSTTRASMLREAEGLLMRAADLMDGALRMSGMASRSGNDSATIRRIASDPSYGGSLRNIALDIERLEKDPVWTRPLTSPKNMFPSDDDAMLDREGERASVPERGYRDHEDAVRASERHRGGAADHAQHRGLPPHDLRDLQEVLGRLIDLVHPGLHLERAPSPIGHLDHRIRLVPVGIAIAVQLTAICLRVDPEVALAHGLEHGDVCIQVVHRVVRGQSRAAMERDGSARCFLGFPDPDGRTDAHCECRLDVEMNVIQ